MCFLRLGGSWCLLISLLLCFTDFFVSQFPCLYLGVMNGNRLVPLLFLSLAYYPLLGRSCFWTVHGVIDRILGVARLAVLLGHPFGPSWFVLCLFDTVPRAFYLLFFFSLLFMPGLRLFSVRAAASCRLISVSSWKVCFLSLISVVACRLAVLCDSFQRKYLVRSGRYVYLHGFPASRVSVGS